MTDADPWRDVAGALQRFGPIFHADLSRDALLPAMARRALADAPAPLTLIGRRLLLH